MRLGKISEVCLKRSVLRQIKTGRKEVISGAGIGKDCAVLSFGDARAAVCAQEAAVRLSDADKEAEPCGPEPVMTVAQLIQKAANNLAAGGAEPIAAFLCLILPESAGEPRIKAAMAEAEKICGELSIEIAGGQTRASAAVKEMIMTVTCVGQSWDDVLHTAKAAAPGQDVVLSKWIGLQGTALLARRRREELLKRYPVWLVEEAESFGKRMSVIPEARVAAENGVCAMHDVSEGGIFGALRELAEGAGVGLTIDMRKLPLRQETVEVCEFCGVNPYLLLSGGSLLMTTQDGPGLAAALEAAGIPAAVVGKVTEGNDRILLNDGEIRYLDRPGQDEIWVNARGSKDFCCVGGEIGI